MNKKVIGVLGMDNGKFSEVLARQTTSFYIPTITYMYNDEVLMNQQHFPTLISLISTKEQEGKLIARFLERMDYGYVDAWYHELSTEIANYVSEEYLPKHGCGRAQEMSTDSDLNNELLKEYDSAIEKSAAVQLLLQNNKRVSVEWMKNVTEDLGFRDKIYVMGSSMGRVKFHQTFNEIIAYLNDSDDTIIYPLPTLVNTQLIELDKDIGPLWESQDGELDKLYRKAQQVKKCGHGSGCDVTSWSPHVVAGTKILLRALQDVLKQTGSDKCAEILNCTDTTNFRRSIFEKIVDESREIEVELQRDITLNVRFKGRTIEASTKLEVYRSKTKDSYILGTISPESFEVTNHSLLKDISHYRKRCEADCPPGKYKTYGTVEQLTNLPCCWQCNECPPNQFSNETNQNSCYKCRYFEKSSDNKTACYNVEHIYIKTGSKIFVGGLIFALVGVVLVILTVFLVMKNEERPVIKASDPSYLYTILASIAAGFLGSLMPLLEPTQSSCTMEHVMMVIFSTLITVNLLWKCIKIHAIFAAANSFKRPKFEIFLKQAGQVFLNAASLAFVIVFLLIDIFGTKPGWKFEEYQEHDHQSIYPSCILSNGYRGVIAIIPMTLPLLYFLTTLIFVFKMRKFPHNFRETLNILAATLIVLFCCVMFLSGYSVSPPVTKSLLRAVIIYVTSFAFLFCLFLPKVALLMKKDVDHEAEKRMITESLQAFSTRRSKESKRLSVMVTTSGRSSPMNTPSPDSSKLGGRKSQIASAAPSPIPSPSSVRHGRASLIIAHAGGRYIPPRKLSLPARGVRSFKDRVISTLNNQKNLQNNSGNVKIAVDKPDAE